MSILGLLSIHTHMTRAPAQDIPHSHAGLVIRLLEGQELCLETAKEGNSSADHDAVTFENPAVPDAGDALQVEAVCEEGAEYRFPDFFFGEVEGFVEVG